ncbi:MAG TPA: Na+/H+ antiporter NhaA [Candidatus Saccharimonadales bacterium]|nr:Na+/H+ antiporter NhaA [Candidatus Saccharimonadales bacterium]
MFKHKLQKSAKKVHGHVSRVVQLLLKDEAISGKFLLLAAVAAIIIVNSPVSPAFNTFWEHDFSINIANFTLGTDLRHWINDGLMAIFFLVISLEIKRELVRGELRKPRAAILPIVAALGGIAAPIAIYFFINNGFSGAHGWGIPMTTDTAFAIGLLALLGRRIPTSLKIFLLTSMVVDDVAAIGAIAVFYTDSVDFVALGWAGGLYAVILVLHWLGFLRMRLFVALGIALWVTVFLSGVHASIAGVILGLAAPISVRHYANKLSIAERLERSLIPFSTFLIIPLFALANAGVVLDWHVFNEENAMRAGLGIFLGLVVGKVIGIVVAVWIATKLRLTSLPKNVTMHHIIGVAMIAGVGFTLSIFIAKLAFGTNDTLISAAKMSIFSASIISAMIGLFYLRFIAVHKQKRRT